MRQKEFEVTEASNQLFLSGKASISFCDIKQILERCVPPPPPKKKLGFAEIKSRTYRSLVDSVTTRPPSTALRSAI